MSVEKLEEVLRELRSRQGRETQWREMVARLTAVQLLEAHKAGLLPIKLVYVLAPTHAVATSIMIHFGIHPGKWKYLVAKANERNMDGVAGAVALVCPGLTRGGPAKMDYMAYLRSRNVSLFFIKEEDYLSRDSVE